MTTETTKVRLRVTTAATVCRFCNKRTTIGDTMHRVDAESSGGRGYSIGRGYYCPFIFEELKRRAAEEVPGLKNKAKEAQQLAVLLGCATPDTTSEDQNQDLVVEVSVDLLTNGDLLRTFWPADKAELIRRCETHHEEL